MLQHQTEQYHTCITRCRRQKRRHSQHSQPTQVVLLLPRCSDCPGASLLGYASGRQQCVSPVAWVEFREGRVFFLEEKRKKKKKDKKEKRKKWKLKLKWLRNLCLCNPSRRRSYVSAFFFSERGNFSTAGRRCPNNGLDYPNGQRMRRCHFSEHVSFQNC